MDSTWKEIFPLRNKTIWVGVIIPMFGDNMTINARSGMMLLQTYRFVLDYINRGLVYNLNGFHFKLRRAFPSNQVEYSNAMLSYIRNCYESTVVLFMGPSSPVHTEHLASMSIALPMVYISQASTLETKDLERVERSSHSNYYIDYVYQTVPSDTFRFTAVHNLIAHLRWNYMTVLSSVSLMEHADAFVHNSQYHNDNICLHSLILFDSSNVYQSMWHLKKITKPGKVKILVCFTDNQDSRYLLKALKEQNLVGRFHLVFPYGAVNNVEVVRGYEDVVVGSLSLDVTNYRKFNSEEQQAELKSEEAEYRNYLLGLTPEKEKTVYFHLYWEQTFECRLKSDILEKHLPNRHRFSKSCTGSEKMQIGKGVYPNMGAFRGTMQSLKTVAKAFHFIIGRVPLSCNRTFDYFSSSECRDCAWKYMRCIRSTFQLVLAALQFNGRLLDPNIGKYSFPNASYEFYNFQLTESGYKAVVIGNWTTIIHEGKTPTESMHASKQSFTINTDQIVWKNSPTGVTPFGNCSKECSVGSIRVYDRNLHSRRYSRCCWTCAKCAKNSIIQDNVCQQCGRYQRADVVNGVCHQLPIYYLYLFSDISGWVLGILVMFGIGSVLVVTVVYALNNEKRIIKSSGRDMSYSMLFGTLVLFLTTFVFTTEPNQEVCLMREIIPSVAFMICFLSLLMKNLRLYRIFGKYRTKLTQPKMISPISQVICLLGCCGFQIAIPFAWTAADGEFPGRKRVLSDNGQYVVLRCDGDDNKRLHFLLNNCVSIVCIVLCSILSYRLRDLPKNYNESKGYAGTAFIVTFLLSKSFCYAFYVCVCMRFR